MPFTPDKLRAPTALKSFWEKDDGQDLVEYSLLLAVIAFALIAILNGLGGNVDQVFSRVNNALSSASSAARGGSS